MIIGLAIGLCIPVVGYALFLIALEQIEQHEISFHMLDWTLSRRFRSLTLFAILLNIIPVQIFKRRYDNEKMKGVILLTLIYSCIWVIYFWKTFGH